MLNILEDYLYQDLFTKKVMLIKCKYFKKIANGGAALMEC